MPKEIASIANILTEWQLTKEYAQKKSQGLFASTTEFDTIDRLMKQLKINHTMSLDDLVNALKIIENVGLKKDSPTINFGQWLNKNRYRVLQDLKVPGNTKPSDNLIKQDSGLFRLLVKNHQMLLNYYVLARAHAHGELPVSQFKYSDDQIKLSQAINDLELTSQAVELPDQATSVKDFKRKGVTLYGATIYPREPDNDKDPLIIETIENFTGDKVTTPHSKANKILNFGGQFLQAIVLQEFSNTYMLAGSDHFGMERGIVKGHINWSKDADTQEIYATVNVKMLTCVYADPNDLDTPQKFFALGTDGSSLVDFNDDLEKVLGRCTAEVTKVTEDSVAPICELTAKIKLTKNELGTGYMLQVIEFTNKINSPDLVSSKAPADVLAPPSPKGP